MRNLIILLAVFALGCSSAPAKPEVDKTADPPPPGAELWRGDALKLPKDSPIVIEVHPREVLASLLRLKTWLVAEPAMFGEDGPAMVERINLGWSFVQAYLGADPSKSSAWSHHGLDVTRPVLVGAYSVSEDSDAFVESVEKSLAESLGLPPVEKSTPESRVALVDALRNTRTAQIVPEGLHANVVRAVSSRTPVTGARVLIPSTDPATLLAFIDALSVNLGYKPFTSQEAERLKLGPLGKAYPGTPDGLPAFSVRVGEGIVIMDLVIAAVAVDALRGADMNKMRPQMLQELQQAIETIEAGPPSAPKAPGDPAASIGFNHDGASHIVRVRGYRQTLEMAKTMGADKRDVVAIQGFMQALVNARAWDLRSDDSPALSYGLMLPQEGNRNVASFEMAMFMSHDTPELKISEPKGGLSVPERGMGFSISFEPFTDPIWRKWLYVERPGDTLDILDAGGTDVLADLATPRNLALILGNLAKTGPESFAPEYAALIELLPLLGRVEFATIDADLKNFETEPRVMFAMEFAKGTGQVDHKTAMELLLGFTSGVVEEVKSTKVPKLEVGPPNAWTEVEPDTLNVRYIYNDDFGFVAVGLTREEAESEYEGAQVTAAGSADAATFRLEPLAALSALTDMDTQNVDFVDPAILAQRMGAINGRVEPSKSGDSRYLSFTIELTKPPKF